VKAKKIIELGTNLGIGSAHLHGAMRSSIFVGIEASKTFVEFTERTLNTLHLGNYQIKHGNFDEYFKDILLSNQDADLIFIDGNHRYDATIRYYKLIKRYVPKECLIIFDDIHWNKDMKKAWNWITQDKECMLSINLFQIGLVWINRTNRSSPKNYSLIPFRLKPLPF
jgi:predicted O-methyltransferase YrrM